MDNHLVMVSCRSRTMVIISTSSCSIMFICTNPWPGKASWTCQFLKQSDLQLKSTCRSHPNGQIWEPVSTLPSNQGHDGAWMLTFCTPVDWIICGSTIQSIGLITIQYGKCITEWGPFLNVERLRRRTRTHLSCPGECPRPVVLRQKGLREQAKAVRFL